LASTGLSAVVVAWGLRRTSPVHAASLAWTIGLSGLSIHILTLILHPEPLGTSLIIRGFLLNIIAAATMPLAASAFATGTLMRQGTS
jgi:hypothetical protein